MDYIPPASLYHSPPPSLSSDTAVTVSRTSSSSLSASISTLPSNMRHIYTPRIYAGLHPDIKGMPDQGTDPSPPLMYQHPEELEPVSPRTLQRLPVELLAKILSSFPSAYLASIMTVSKKFQAVACYVLRLRLIHIIQQLEELKLLLECRQPSDTPSFVICQYQGTRGLGGEDDSMPQRLMDSYPVFKPEVRSLGGSSILTIPEDQTLKRLVSLSAFETFGQFTATLKLLWAPGQLFLTPNNIVRDKSIRLGRKWLERGEPRVFWLDDAEHLGIRLRARQSNESPRGQELDEDERSWEMDVEEILFRAVPFLAEVEQAQEVQNHLTVFHLRG